MRRACRGGHAARPPPCQPAGDPPDQPARRADLLDRPGRRRTRGRRGHRFPCHGERQHLGHAAAGRPDRPCALGRWAALADCAAARDRAGDGQTRSARRRFPAVLEQAAAAPSARARPRCARRRRCTMRRATPRSSTGPAGWASTRRRCALAHGAAAARRGSIATRRCCQALRAVPRHLFVDSALATQAYEDTSLPIGLGQTISKPSVVARMLSSLHEGGRARAQRHARPRARDRHRLRLPDGAAGAAGAAVLSIERLKPLHDKARANLGERSRRTHVRLVYGDGRLGHPPNAPYDSIIAAAGGDDLPAAWLEQLADRRPAGGAACRRPAGGGQVLLVVDRTGDELPPLDARGGALRSLKIRHRIGEDQACICNLKAGPAGCWRPLAIAGVGGMCVLRRARRRSRTAARAAQPPAAAPAPPPRRRRAAPKPLARRRERRQAGLLHRQARRHADPHRAGQRPELARPGALEQPRQPEPDRGRAGAARGAAGADLRCRSGVPPRRRGAEHRARRKPPAGQPAGGLGRGVGVRRGAPAPAPRPRRRPRRAAARGAAAGCGRRRAPARDAGRRRATGSGRQPVRCVAGFDEGRNKGLAISGKAGDPVLAAGRRPRGLRRLGAARLRQPGDRQAQRHLPDGLRAQPDAAGEGRPDRAPRPEDRRDGLDATPSACNCTSRSAARASRSIRPSCCRRASSTVAVATAAPLRCINPAGWFSVSPGVGGRIFAASIARRSSSPLSAQCNLSS